MMSKELNKSILDRISAGRWRDPEDSKGPAIFLNSTASDYVHGENIDRRWSLDGPLIHIED
jgi:hypothetical protein